MSKNSIIQRIWNSQVFTQWLDEQIQQVGGPGANARNLSAAKHRFESHAKPLCRMLLHFEAVLDTAQKIAQRRSGAEASDASRWLASLTEEKMLQLAMVADATDEGLLLTRAMDTEDADLAALHSNVCHFIERITMLFDKGRCVALEPGFTAHMLKLLQTERVIYLNSGKTRVFGGQVAPDIIASCLVRMKCFTKLAREVVSAEFPSYDLFAAFQVFDLGNRSGGPPNGEEGGDFGCRSGGLPNGEEGGDFAQCSSRLAQVFKVDPAELKAQILAHRPIAARIKASSYGFDNRAAWQAAVRKTQGHHGTKAAYPANALMAVLTRYLAFGMSTSGVEQSFSVGLRALEPARLNMSEDIEEATLRFATLKWQRSESDSELPKLLVQRARELWVECGFGQSRTHTAQRADSGIKRHHSADAEPGEGGERAWLKAKRHAVANALAETHIDGCDAKAADPDVGELGPQGTKKRKNSAKRDTAEKLRLCETVCYCRKR